MCAALYVLHPIPGLGVTAAQPEAGSNLGIAYQVEVPGISKDLLSILMCVLVSFCLTFSCTCRRHINAASDTAVYVMDRRLRGGSSSNSSRRNLHKDACDQQEIGEDADERVYRRHGAQKSRCAKERVYLRHVLSQIRAGMMQMIGCTAGMAHRKAGLHVAAQMQRRYVCRTEQRCAVQIGRPSCGRSLRSAQDLQQRS